jgi:single-strand DNA-binding protein
LEGELRTREWEREGQKHYTTEIVANEMQMLDSRGGMEGGGGGNFGGSGGQSGRQQDDFGPPPSDDFDDDIPF